MLQLLRTMSVKIPLHVVAVAVDAVVEKLKKQGQTLSLESIRLLTDLTIHTLEKSQKDSMKFKLEKLFDENHQSRLRAKSAKVIDISRALKKARK